MTAIDRQSIVRIAPNALDSVHKATAMLHYLVDHYDAPLAAGQFGTASGS